MTDKKITIYDTTLRDGAQTLGISFSLQDKLRIARALDRLHVDYIEGGWPGSNPKDDLFFQQIREDKLEHAKIAAFGSTKRKDLSVSEDNFLQALVNSRADVITIVAKSWDFHVTRALGITLDENLTLIRDTVSYLKEKDFTVDINLWENPEYRKSVEFEKLIDEGYKTADQQLKKLFKKLTT